jgi:FkbH-like protein
MRIGSELSKPSPPRPTARTRTPAAEADAELKAALDGAEQTLLAEAGGMANVHAVSSASLLRRYPVDDYYDPHSHHAGHIPYTSECYAAIGTALVRTIFNLKRNPFKVIVLDCDNTLWKGICGEDGPSGIDVTAPYRALQEFMVGQMNAGMLLCLCSKNNEKDVLDVFDQRTDMPLKREHMVSWRINWNRKSENIRSLANELNLGLDSFIFVDDNPVECADVKINCPGVLTLQLPHGGESLPAFLNHIWAFDHAASTGEDQGRTRMYQESAKRERYREQTVSLRNFVEGLQLRVEIAEATEDELGRVSQLTFRTNQFNFTTIRRSETEVKDFLKREGAKCLAVRVVDRFGDYGLVGVVMYETVADRCKVDTLLLSCRVLGRGVEHALVSRLGQSAVEEGKGFVEFNYLPTGRNLPALEFITNIGDPYRNEAGAWVFPAGRLAAVKYDPDEKAPIGHEAPAPANPERSTSRPALGFGVADRSECLQRIGQGLYDIGRLAKAIEEYRLGKQALDATADPTPGNTLETALATIWKKVLGRPRIGMNDNFFEAGGTSLKAVQVIAMIKKELNQTLSIVSLFECPTVKLLAAKLGATSGDARVGAPAAEAALRGQRRRYKATRQHAA